MMQDNTSTVAELKGIVRQFVDERDWRQFHTPKDLAIGISVEAAELLEHFRFRSEEEIKERLKETASRQAVGHELADVLYFVLLMCEQLDMDASTLLREKMAISAGRYPVEKARGRNAKYTEL
ncbi:MAG: nucleotide pyrophosphohydrolase [Candidatus Latescibacterota bacterium]|nr:nucleotide pyrophosphohydrolase [Candidatus Latescibacterota bacterium]